MRLYTGKYKAKNENWDRRICRYSNIGGDLYKHIATDRGTVIEKVRKMTDEDHIIFGIHTTGIFTYKVINGEIILEKYYSA